MLCMVGKKVLKNSLSVVNQIQVTKDSINKHFFWNTELIHKARHTYSLREFWQILQLLMDTL